MSSSTGGGPKDKATPQRVPVHYFPKKSKSGGTAAGSAPAQIRTVTVTLPEMAAVDGPDASLDGVDRITEPDLHLDRRGASVSRRSTKKPSKRDEDITDKATDPRTPRMAASAKSVRRHFRELAMKGHRLFERGKLQEARRVLESVVAEQPEDPFPHTMLGTVYLALGAPDRALALFEVALELDPDDLAARVYRGEIRLNRGKRKAGLRDLHHAVQLAPKDDPFVQRARKLIRRVDSAGTTR